MRWLVLATGAVMVVIAFLAGGQVADTREGLNYEVIALLAGLAGVSLVLYAWVGPAMRARARSLRPAVKPQPPVRVRSANELLIGGAGLVIAAILVIGIGLSAGMLWALLGLAMLLPMIVGCAYLSLRFFRAPARKWKIDLEGLTHRR